MEIGARAQQILRGGALEESWQGLVSFARPFALSLLCRSARHRLRPLCPGQPLLAPSRPARLDARSPAWCSSCCRLRPLPRQACLSLRRPHRLLQSLDWLPHVRCCGTMSCSLRVSGSIPAFWPACARPFARWRPPERRASRVSHLRVESADRIIHLRVDMAQLREAPVAPPISRIRPVPPRCCCQQTACRPASGPTTKPSSKR